MLSAFLTTIAGQDADLLFETAEPAVQLFLATLGASDEVATRVALSREAAAFDAEFPAGSAIRQRAWWALGANAGSPQFIAMIIDGLSTMPRPR